SQIISVSFLLLVGSVNGQTPLRQELLEIAGNKTLSTEQLRDVTKRCLGNGENSRAHNRAVLDYCAWRLRMFLGTKGYLQATVVATVAEDREDMFRVSIAINEGARFRLGHVDIHGSIVFSPEKLREMFNLVN